MRNVNEEFQWKLQMCLCAFAKLHRLIKVMHTMALQINCLTHTYTMLNVKFQFIYHSTCSSHSYLCLCVLLAIIWPLFHSWFGLFTVASRNNLVEVDILNGFAIFLSEFVWFLFSFSFDNRSTLYFHKKSLGIELPLCFFMLSPSLYLPPTLSMVMLRGSIF